MRPSVRAEGWGWGWGLRVLMREQRLESKNLYFMNKNYFCKERRPKRPFPRDPN